MVAIDLYNYNTNTDTQTNNNNNKPSMDSFIYKIQNYDFRKAIFEDNNGKIGKLDNLIKLFNDVLKGIDSSYLVILCMHGKLGNIENFSKKSLFTSENMKSFKITKDKIPSNKESFVYIGRKNGTVYTCSKTKQKEGPCHYRTIVKPYISGINEIKCGLSKYSIVPQYYIYI